jgi:hypothetical protein
LGYKCFHKRKNPQVKDRVNAFLVKLAPLKGAPSWSCLLPKCEELAEICERLEWAGDGNYLDKTEGYDHGFDAASYPVSYFEPAASIQIPRLIGMVAR